jgi:hypothetical protein
MRLALFLALLPFLPAAQAQPGCPDPQATNFNPGATQNDGSCLYPVTNYTPVFRANLNSDLKEISGLHRANGEWWGHNDSGYDPDIFSIDPETGARMEENWPERCQKSGLGRYLRRRGQPVHRRLWQQQQ